MAHHDVGVPGQDIDAAVSARIRRQQVLYSGKPIEILIAEGALLHSPVPPAVLAGRLHQPMARIGLPNVRIGSFRPGASSRTSCLAFTGSSMTWLVETVAEELRVVYPDQAATYRQLTDRPWAVAVEGEQARALLARVAGQSGG